MQNNSLTGYPSIDKPWLKYYSEEAINELLPKGTIFEYMWENNKNHLSDIAIIYYGRKITYRMLFRKIDQCASALTALGVREKEIVTVALPSIPEALYLVYALNRIGAVANMIHPMAGERELVFYLNEVNTKIAFVYDATYHIIKDAISKTPVKKTIVISAGESLPVVKKQLYFLKNKQIKPNASSRLNWNQFLHLGSRRDVPTVRKDAHTLALISHTGGTTGEPKGVMCSDCNVNALIYQLVSNFEYTRQGTCLAILPPFINYSLIDSMMAMLYIGFKVVLIPNYAPEKLGEYINRYHPNVINSIPAYWEALLQIENIQTVDMSCLKYIYYGGEAMSAKNEMAINGLLQACSAKSKLGKGLGCTEMMAAATQTYSDCNSDGSVGVPLVWTNCKIIEPGRTLELTYNQEGEICFAGPTVMMGYYNNLEATNAIVKIHSDGQRWLHTGDLGYIDENGTIFVTGRIKRIIMTKGKDRQVTKMFPDRIEKVLNSHPAVELSCVIGVPDEKRINYAKAVIELNAGHTASEELKSEIREFCCGKLPEYQIPDVIEFTAALPRTDRGKVDYRALE